MKIRSSVAVLIVGCLAFVSAGHAAEADTRSMMLGHDLFVAGNAVEVSQPVAGDVLLAGSDIASSSQIGGDLAAAGEELRISGRVGHDLYAVARSVHIDGTVVDSARAGGDEIVVTRDARVGGGLSLAARRVDFDGQAQGYLSVAASATRINGQVGGDVQVTGRELELGPEARVAGRLVFRGAQPPRLAPGARVTGGVQFVRQQPMRPARMGAVMRAIGWVWLAGWMVAGAALLAIWPVFTRAASEATGTRVLYALGVGVLVLFVTPVAIGLLFVTLVGIPLALLLLGAYLLMVPLGYLTSALAIGDRVFRRGGEPVSGVWRRAGALAVTLLILFVLGRVPVVGALLTLLLVLAGVGGLMLAAAGTSRPAP